MVIPFNDTSVPPSTRAVGELVALASASVGAFLELRQKILNKMSRLDKVYKKVLRYTDDTRLASIYSLDIACVEIVSSMICLNIVMSLMKVAKIMYNVVHHVAASTIETLNQGLPTVCLEYLVSYNITVLRFRKKTTRNSNLGIKNVITCSAFGIPDPYFT